MPHISFPLLKIPLKHILLGLSKFLFEKCNWLILSTTDKLVLITSSNYDYSKNGKSLIKIVFESSQRAILMPAKLGDSRKDKKEEFVGVLEQVDINHLVISI